MIPKVIHYCWFGGKPLPPLAEKCIASWKKFLPDYEIKRWDESNFNVNIIPYTAEAYQAKKYAFVSDYARFWILYKYGGIYFDTDVELIRPIDDIISKGPFMGCECYLSGMAISLNHESEVGSGVNPGLGMGVTCGPSLFNELLNIYAKLSFKRNKEGLPNLTVVDITSNLLHKKGLQDSNCIQFVDGVFVYPAEYFNPINVITKRIKITENTRSIHHYMASWIKESKLEQIKKILRPFIPEKLLFLWNKRKNKFNNLK